jgi:hypothetical protein
MFDFWMTLGRWLIVLLIGAASFNPFAFLSGSFTLDSLTSVIESTLTQVQEVEEEITEVIDGPAFSDPTAGEPPVNEGPGQIGGPASEGPTTSPSPSPTQTPTEAATAEVTGTPAPTEAPSATPRFDDPVLRWLPEIVSASAKTGVPASLLAAEIKIHSGGYPALAGPGNRHGLAQVPLSAAGVSASALYDPLTNLNIAASRFANFKLATGTWNASILADLDGLCDADCVQQRSTAIRAWRAYYNRVLPNPGAYGFVMLPADWQAPKFNVQVSNTLLPLTYPPGSAPPTATPTSTASLTATASPTETATPIETATSTPIESPTSTSTPTATPTATQTETVTPTPTSTEMFVEPSSKKKK